MILVDSFHAIQVSETVFNSDKLILHVWKVKSLFEGIGLRKEIVFDVFKLLFVTVKGQCAWDVESLTELGCESVGFCAVLWFLLEGIEVARE